MASVMLGMKVGLQVIAVFENGSCKHWRSKNQMYHMTSMKHYEKPKKKLIKIRPLRFDSAKLDKKRFSSQVKLGESFTQHFLSDLNSPRPITLGELVGERKLTVFNSHGSWTTLRKIRELEREERGNTFPALIKYPDDTSAIWVCLSGRKALRYLESADQWDRLSSSSPLTNKDKELMRDISQIELLPSDIVACTDFEDGYLILRSRK